MSNRDYGYLRKKSGSTDIVINGSVFLVATLAALVVAEVVLRLPVFEPVPLDYRDTWRSGGLGPGGYLKEKFSGYVRDGFGGKVRWTNNSQGFRSDTEFDVPKPQNVFRVLSLGDSFVGGYRIGQQETFSFLLQEALSERYPGRKIEVMISVVEDPRTGFRWLRDRGINYAPDLILLGITLGNDLAQIYAAEQKWSSSVKKKRLPESCLINRGSGVERDGPKWSKIPGYNNVPDQFRLLSLIRRVLYRSHPDEPQTVISDSEDYTYPKLFESNGLGIFLSPPPDEVARAYDATFAVLSEYKTLAERNSIEVLTVIFPQRFQVQPRDWDATRRIYGLNDSCFDLNIPGRRIKAFCERLGVRCVDPTISMQNAYSKIRESLYLPYHDMHWNSVGHKVVAGILFPEVEYFLKAILSESDAANN